MSKVRTIVYKGAGHFFLGLGIFGIFVPLLPTTVFWILATGCYANSAPHLRERILRHPRFGRPISDWLEFRVIERKPKIFAVAGIIVGCGISALSVPSDVFVIACAPMLVLIMYLVTRPERHSGTRAEQVASSQTTVRFYSARSSSSTRRRSSATSTPTPGLTAGIPTDIVIPSDKARSCSSLSLTSSGDTGSPTSRRSMPQR